MKKLTLPLLLCFALPGASFANDAPDLYEIQRSGNGVATIIACHGKASAQSCSATTTIDEDDLNQLVEALEVRMDSSDAKRFIGLGTSGMGVGMLVGVSFSGVGAIVTIPLMMGGVIVGNYYKHPYFFYKDFLAQIEDGIIGGEGEVLAFKAFIENPAQVLQKLKAQPFPDLDQFDPATLSP